MLYKSLFLLAFSALAGCMPSPPNDASSTSTEEIKDEGKNSSDQKRETAPAESIAVQPKTINGSPSHEDGKFALCFPEADRSYSCPLPVAVSEEDVSWHEFLGNPTFVIAEGHLVVKDEPAELHRIRLRQLPDYRFFALDLSIFLPVKCASLKCEISEPLTNKAADSDKHMADYFARHPLTLTSIVVDGKLQQLSQTFAIAAESKFEITYKLGSTGREITYLGSVTTKTTKSTILYPTRAR